jgi:ribosomal protein S27E
VTGRDTTAPTIGLLPENLVVPKGEALRVSVRDNIGVTRVTYRIDGGAERQASYAEAEKLAIIDTADLNEGLRSIVIRAFDAAGNTATRQMSFIVGPQLPPGVPPPPLDPGVITTASGVVQLRWVVVPSANLDHFEVWRAASPEQKLGEVDPEEDCDGGVCTFSDRSARAGVKYTYCILAVNATSVTGGFDYPSKTCMEVTCATCLRTSGTFLEDFWWVFLIAAAIVVGVAVFLVQREERAKKSRSRRKLETVPVGPGERHHIKCPACTTRFTVTGTKPIVTNCPHCGKKGILR